MNIDLTRPLELPEEYVCRLASIKTLCRVHKHAESLMERDDVWSIVRDLDDFCKENKVLGIHYTRAIPSSIKEKGLLIRNGSEIRKKFLEEHGYRFTNQEIDIIKSRWRDYFKEDQSPERDGRIYFNFTELALNEGRANKLIGLYGGEQVSMHCELDDPIGRKLASIGVPLLVKCSLQPHLLKTHKQYPWGEILVSTYHKHINVDASVIDQDAFQVKPVSPEDVVEIRTIDKSY